MGTPVARIRKKYKFIYFNQKSLRGPFRAPRRRREDNIKMDPLWREDVDRIHLVQNGDQWGSLVNMLMSHRVSLQKENFFQKAFNFFLLHDKHSRLADNDRFLPHANIYTVRNHSPLIRFCKTKAVDTAFLNNANYHYR
jgi:hypothetical protein